MRRLVSVGVAVFATLVCTAYGDSSVPPGSSPDTAIALSPSARIAWDQTAASLVEVQSYEFLGYVDDTPNVLKGGVCQSSASAGVFSCSAGLPPMSAGVHRLQLAARTTVSTQLEGPKSTPLYINLSSAIALSVGVANETTELNLSRRSVLSTVNPPRIVTLKGGGRITIDTLLSDLDAPSSLIATPDGRIFIAQSSGEVLVWQAGQLASPPAIRLNDAVRPAVGGLIGMALDPEFATNRRVYLAYTSRGANTGLVNRIVRFRELNNLFAEAAVILEDRIVSVPPRSPRLRFGPDRKLYASFPADDWEAANSSASYAGKILRLNDDGTTPKDNREASPIVSSGHLMMGGFDWQPGTAQLWITERNRQALDVVSAFSTDFETAVRFSLPGGAEPWAATFHRTAIVPGLTNDLFVATAGGQQLLRIHFNPQDPTRVQHMESLLDRAYGRLGDVLAGSDGALYVSTINRSASSKSAGHDYLLRLLPAR